MSANTPLVSVIMLTYNRGWCIAEAISSVLAQTYQNFELIIINDGSTDDTTAIVAGFADSRIKYLDHADNQGLLIRRHESLKVAQGVYVAVLDSDDVWCRSDKLTKQVEYLEENPSAVLVGTNLIKIDNTGKEVGRSSYYTTDQAIRQNILSRNQFAHSSVLIRQSSITKTAGYGNFPVAEDLAFFLDLGQYGTFANLPDYATKYRMHGTGESSNKIKMVENVLAIIKLHKNHYPNYLPAWTKYNLYLLYLKLI